MVELNRTIVAVVCGLGCWIGAAAPAAAGPGGAYASAPAKITSLQCVADCPAVGAAQPGSLLRIRGTGMKGVTKIVFLGGGGHRDNASAIPRRQRVKSVDVTVPEAASSGRLRAVNEDGARSKPSRALVSIQRGGDGSGPLDAQVVGSGLFYHAARPARIDLLARQPMTVTLALVRVQDGAVIATWPGVALPVGVVHSVSWDGTVDGIAQPSGRYEFRVVEDSAGTQALAQASSALASSAFDLADHKFPVRGKHDFGGLQANFGAARIGHSHQGHDVFADCGTPLLAARGGVVKINDYDGAGGNYIVIDGDGTDVDYAYMHLRDPSPLSKGTRVPTGRLVGHVGVTGRTTGCHLHFEMWGAPGWSAGGAPIDPLPFLRAWDVYS